MLPVLYLAAVIVISHDHPTDPATAPCLRPPDGHTWQGGGGGGVSVYPVYICTARRRGQPGLQSSVSTLDTQTLSFTFHVHCNAAKLLQALLQNLKNE